MRAARDAGLPTVWGDTAHIEVLESMLHDDLAGFIYDKLKRRPMVLPVVVEV